MRKLTKSESGQPNTLIRVTYNYIKLIICMSIIIMILMLSVLHVIYNFILQKITFLFEVCGGVINPASNEVGYIITPGYQETIMPNQNINLTGKLRKWMNVIK